ncbi:MAG TPA: DUF1684 domain-containing protein [Solirubrobacteraceae bacterium]|nr:DUF1684 domain-containing protein [Solirubrobacteraceae bacterium]
MTVAGELDPLVVLDWRRRIAELYREVRGTAEPQAAWEHWRATRDELFADHPASPIPAAERPAFDGLGFFDYDPVARVEAGLRPAAGLTVELAAADGAIYTFTRFATAGFNLAGRPFELDVHWLHGYAGGVFVSFTDRTSGERTYGGGRYVLDTIKGADLGGSGGRLTLDFNFAYNPSCSYDPAWSCPLPSGTNRLDWPVTAGELAWAPAAGDR